jgi:hypothetical protein
LAIIEDKEKYYLVKSGNYYLNESNENNNIYVDEEDILDIIEKDSSEVNEILESWREERD